MKLENIPFLNTDWSKVEPKRYEGLQGHALWRTLELGNIRVRMVEYSPGYRADHWCSKGHVVLVLEGNIHTELKDGRTFVTHAGMSYQVADNDGEHRSGTDVGARLFIVD